MGPGAGGAGAHVGPGADVAGARVGAGGAGAAAPLCRWCKARPRAVNKAGERLNVCKKCLTEIPDDDV